MLTRRLGRFIQTVFTGQVRVRSKLQIVIGSIALVLVIIAPFYALNLLFPSDQPPSYDYALAIAATTGIFVFVDYGLEALLDRIGKRRTE